MCFDRASTLQRKIMRVHLPSRCNYTQPDTIAQRPRVAQLRGGGEAARGSAAGGGGHQRRRPPARGAGAADAGRGLRPHPPHQLRGGPLQVRQLVFVGYQEIKPMPHWLATAGTPLHVLVVQQWHDK